MIALRAFGPADDAALIDWVASPEELLRFGGPSLAWPLDIAQLEVERRDPAVEPLTAYLPGGDERPVGHVGIALRDGVARLGRVIVAPDRRREGLGRAMVAAALELAVERGASAADLVVYADNAPARALYRSLGFAFVPTPGGDAALLHLRRGLTAQEPTRHLRGGIFLPSGLPPTR